MSELNEWVNLLIIYGFRRNLNKCFLKVYDVFVVGFLRIENGKEINLFI